MAFSLSRKGSIRYPIEASANFLNDDQYYDYSPSQVEAILFGILQLTPEHQDIIVIDHKKTEILHQLEISNLLEQLKNN